MAVQEHRHEKRPDRRLWPFRNAPANPFICLTAKDYATEWSQSFCKRMRPTFKLMGKTLLFCLALCWMTTVGRAQAPALPTIRILPEDVVQNTIQQIRFNTNSFAVRWTYTEAGARKMLAFWEAHEGQKVKTAVGSFETGSSELIFRPMPPAFTNYAQWKEGWLKRRIDKIFGVSENDAKAIAAGLKSKE